MFIAHENFQLIPYDIRSQFSVQNPYLIVPVRLNNIPFVAPHVGNGLYNSFEQILNQYSITPARTISVSNQLSGTVLASKGLGVQLASNTIFNLSELYGIDLNTLDFLTLPNMNSTRKCIGIYNKGSIKENIIQDCISIIRKEII